MAVKVVGFIEPEKICERYKQEIKYKLGSTWLQDGARNHFRAALEDCNCIADFKMLLNEIETHIRQNKEFVQSKNKKASH